MLSHKLGEKLHKKLKLVMCLLKGRIYLKKTNNKNNKLRKLQESSDN